MESGVRQVSRALVFYRLIKGGATLLPGPDAIILLKIFSLFVAILFHSFYLC